MRIASPLAQLFPSGMPPLRHALILLGFSLPISLAMNNLLLAILSLGILFNARAVWQIASSNPVARASWLLFGALLIAACYGETPWRGAFGYLTKYDGLAFVPVFMLLLSCEASRRWAQYAFLAAMGVTLVLSYLEGFGLLPVQHWMDSTSSASDPVIFLSHIAQNNMMAFATFLALLQMRQATSMRMRVIWGTFAGLALVNVVFLVSGRTGYLIMLALLGWFAWTTLARHLKQRGIAHDWRHSAGVVLFLVGLGSAAFFASPRLHERVSVVATDIQPWQPNRGENSSAGQRLDFYYNTLKIVLQHPWFGVGTGGYKEAFARQTQGLNIVQQSNPHNEYLMISLQTGVVGLVLMLYLFYTVWRYAPLLDTPFAQDAARGLVLAYVVNCMFNCALRDHADGLLFAYMAALLFANLKPVSSPVVGMKKLG